MLYPIGSNLPQSKVRIRARNARGQIDAASTVPITPKFIIMTHRQNINHDSKIHGANVGSTWGRQDPGGSHVGHMNHAIWEGMVMWEAFSCRDVIMSGTFWCLNQAYIHDIIRVRPYPQQNGKSRVSVIIPQICSIVDPLTCKVFYHSPGIHLFGRLCKQVLLAARPNKIAGRAKKWSLRGNPFLVGRWYGVNDTAHGSYSIIPIGNVSLDTV